MLQSFGYEQLVIALIVSVSFTVVLMRYFGKSNLIERGLVLANRLWFSWSLQNSEILGTWSRCLFAFIIRKWRTMDMFSTSHYTLHCPESPAKEWSHPQLSWVFNYIINEIFVRYIYLVTTPPITLVILNSADHYTNYVAHIFFSSLSQTWRCSLIREYKILHVFGFHICR